jgi:predicted transcriptional regulator
MVKKKSRVLTGSELDFMKVLWDMGETTPEEMQAELSARGRDLTHGTIRNVLVVMIEKGYITRRKRGKAYLYAPEIGETEARQSLLRNLIEQAFDGSGSSLVATLLGSGDVDSAELKEIRRLIGGGKEEEE